MVARAVPMLGGVRTPSQAGPLIKAAIESNEAGSVVEAAIFYRDALHRLLVADCLLHGLRSDGDIESLLHRLDNARVRGVSFYRESLAKCDHVFGGCTDVNCLRLNLEISMGVLGYFHRRDTI